MDVDLDVLSEVMMYMVDDHVDNDNIVTIDNGHANNQDMATGNILHLRTRMGHGDLSLGRAVHQGYH